MVILSLSLSLTHTHAHTQTRTYTHPRLFDSVRTQSFHVLNTKLELCRIEKEDTVWDGQRFDGKNYLFPRWAAILIEWQVLTTSNHQQNWKYLYILISTKFGNLQHLPFCFSKTERKYCSSHCIFGWTSRSCQSSR